MILPPERTYDPSLLLDGWLIGAALVGALWLAWWWVKLASELRHPEQREKPKDEEPLWW